MISHFWFLLDIGYDYEAYVCHECHVLSMMVYDLDDFMILNMKGVDYRFFVNNKSKNTAMKLLNNSQLDTKAHYEFGF